MSNHFGIARTFFLCGIVDFVCLGLFLVYAGSQFQTQGLLTSSNGNLSSAESKNRKRIESEKSKKAQQLLAKGLKARAAGNVAKKVKKGDKMVVGKGEGGLGSILPTMALAAIKISLMVSPIAVAWAMLYTPL